MKTIYKKQFGGNLYPSVLEVQGMDSERRLVRVHVTGRSDQYSASVAQMVGMQVSGEVILDEYEARKMATLLLAWLNGDDNVGAVMPAPKGPVDSDEVPPQYFPRRNDNMKKSLELVA